MTPIKPSHLKKWNEIDQSNASVENTAGCPELYHWFEFPESGIWYPHRRPTLEEISKDCFV